MTIFVGGSWPATYPTVGLSIFTLYSTGLTLTKNGSEPVRFPKPKKDRTTGVDKGGKNSLASPIRVGFGWLPTSDLTMSTEETCYAGHLPSLLGLLRFSIT